MLIFRLAYIPAFLSTFDLVPDQSKNPDIAQIYDQGYGYLKRDFPELSYINSCVVKDAVQPSLTVEDDVL
jgi:hypothetical protein